MFQLITNLNEVQIREYLFLLETEVARVKLFVEKTTHKAFIALHPDPAPNPAMTMQYPGYHSLKIEAIKWLRTTHPDFAGWGLKETKDFMDRLDVNHPLIVPVALYNQHKELLDRIFVSV